MIVRYTSLLLIVLIALVPPASADGIALRGWGPRVGVASEPDQVLAGVHWDIGDLASHVRIVPNVQLGVGDDTTVIEGTVPVHYVFGKTGAGFTPYVGGGIAVAWFDVDHDDDNDHDSDDSDVEIGAKATGGLEWGLKSGNRFFLELNLGIGDLHDFQAVAGWTF